MDNGITLKSVVNSKGVLLLVKKAKSIYIHDNFMVTLSLNNNSRKILNFKRFDDAYKQFDKELYRM